MILKNIISDLYSYKWSAAKRSTLHIQLKIIPWYDHSKSRNLCKNRIIVYYFYIASVILSNLITVFFSTGYLLILNKQCISLFSYTFSPLTIIHITHRQNLFSTLPETVNFRPFISIFHGEKNYVLKGQFLARIKLTVLHATDLLFNHFINNCDQFSELSLSLFSCALSDIYVRICLKSCLEKEGHSQA
jgi:hypothetical protein